MRTMIQEKLESAHNLTINLDCWTDISNHSVITCNIVFPDRTIAQWDCRDVSAESHTADFLAGMLTAMYVSALSYVMHIHSYGLCLYAASYVRLNMQG